MGIHVESIAANKRARGLRLASYVGLPVASLAGLVFLINLYEPELEPAAFAAMQAHPSHVPDSENAYFVHFGLGVPYGQDPHAHGVRFVEEYNALMQSIDAERRSGDAEVEALARQNETVPWRGATDGLCGEERTNCLDAYEARRPQIRTLTQDNPLRLERYRSLYPYEAFSEVSLNRIEVWPPGLGGAEHETVLAQIGLKALDGNVEAACADLVRDTAYWRRVLAGAITLVTKTVAANHLSRNYALASEIVARYGTGADVSAVLSEMTGGLTAEERSWERPLQSEFQWMAHLYASVPKNRDQGVFSREESWWDSFLTWTFYSPSATINLQHRYFEKLQTLSEARADAFIESVRDLEDYFAAFVDPIRLDMVYNPVGKILVAVGTPSPESFARYVGRVHNLDGQIRLLELQLRIRRIKLSESKVAWYLEHKSAGLLDPYRNQPFRWDPSSREIWFHGIHPEPKGTLSPTKRFAVRI